MIDHRFDVIKTADWVLDLGPQGGVKGGEVVAQGTPEQVAKAKRSFTECYLVPWLERGGKAVKAGAGSEQVAAE